MDLATRRGYFSIDTVVVAISLLWAQGSEQVVVGYVGGARDLRHRSPRARHRSPIRRSSGLHRSPRTTRDDAPVHLCAPRVRRLLGDCERSQVGSGQRKECEVVRRTSVGSATSALEGNGLDSKSVSLRLLLGQPASTPPPDDKHPSVCPRL